MTSLKMKFIYIALFLIGHTCLATQETEPIKINMINALHLEGDTFDNVTYGHDIMFLFWNSSSYHDRMFKGSAWNMLATEKDKWVKSNQEIIIGEMDCGLEKNKFFCTNFIAFNISNLTYPYIAYSHNNERFKRYNGSMEYPALTSFLYEYFERNCALNRKWCTEKHLEILQQFEKLPLQEKLQKAMEHQKHTDEKVEEFEKWRAELHNIFDKRLRELQDWTLEQDEIGRIMKMIIRKGYVEEQIHDEMDEFRKEAYTRIQHEKQQEEEQQLAIANEEL
tara:strand:- start:572 stop:1408 length:837 start_codon:yes stop_codon:yes gene_type:complete